MHPSRAYVLYNLLSGLAGSAIVVAYIPLLLKIGMSLSEIALVNVVFWGIIVILEIPTGVLADGKSRRFSVSCGAAATAAGYAMYAAVRGFWTVLVAECLIGIGHAFISGALSAWLTDALRHRGEGDKLRHSLAAGSIATSVAFLLGGFASALWIAPSHPRVCMGLAAFLSAMTFVCVRLAMSDDGEPVHRVSELEALRESVSVLRRKRSLIWSTAAAFSWGLVIPFNLYWVPLLKDRSGIQAVAWAWVPMYGACAVAGYAIRRIKARPGHETGMITLAVLMAGAGLAFIIMTATFPALLALVIIHELGRGLFIPLLDAFTQQHVEEHYRATYGSLQSFLGKMGYVAALSIASVSTSGRPADGRVIGEVFVLSGVGLIAVAALLWMFRPRSAK